MNTWKTRQVAGCAEQLIWKGFKYGAVWTLSGERIVEQRQMWTFECSTFNNNLSIQNVFI